MRLGKYIFFMILLFNCGNNIPYSEETILRRPVGITITAKPGLSFDLSYYVQNEEKTFDGYNLYISRNTIGDSEVETGILPLNLSGTLPTFQHSSEQVDLTNPIIQNISLYSDSITKFEKDVVYYFRITAHSRFGYISEASNEVFAAALE